eukprot:3560265-Alexandrium_andersonii.AAC.1
MGHWFHRAERAALANTPRNFGFGAHAEVAPGAPWLHRNGAARGRQHAQKCICAGSPKSPKGRGG